MAIVLTWKARARLLAFQVQEAQRVEEWPLIGHLFIHPALLCPYAHISPLLEKRASESAEVALEEDANALSIRLLCGLAGARA